jgi:mono/diheme cytochrome c family protein
VNRFHVRAAAGLLLLAACSEKEPAVSGRTFAPGPVPPELATGELLFNQSCAQCHGALAMGSDRGPPLVHIIYEPGHHADEAFRRAVTLGSVAHHWSFGPMPAQPAVTPEQTEVIIRYVRWLQRKGGIT